MRGFETNTNPVMLHIDESAGLGAGPFSIDGANAELTADGIRADVGDTRYFVPIRHIRHISQKQDVQPEPQTPVVPAPPPAPTGE